MGILDETKQTIMLELDRMGVHTLDSITQTLAETLELNQTRVEELLYELERSGYVGVPGGSGTHRHFSCVPPKCGLTMRGKSYLIEHHLL